MTAYSKSSSKSSHLDNFIEIGKAIKAFGKDGGLLIEVYPMYKALFVELPALFLEYKANLLPFFVEKIKDRSQDQYLINFESAEGPEYWSQLSSKGLMIHKRDFRPDLVDNESVSEDTLIGFILIDQHHNTIGKIEELRDFPQQTMAVIYLKNQEILIPLVPDWFIDVSILEKVLTMNLPEGIVEL